VCGITRGCSRQSPAAFVRRLLRLNHIVSGQTRFAMADTPRISERATAQQTQEKFELYLLSLVFTLLALSIQTAKFTGQVAPDCFELAGWVLLVLSGMAGLWRMEYLPVFRIKLAQKSEFEEEIFRLRELQLRGEKELHVLQTSSTESIADRIQSRENAVHILGPVIATLETHNAMKYTVHRWSFLAGVLCIVVSRAWSGVLSAGSSLAV
jgi:hypothetical protein